MLRWSQWKFLTAENRWEDAWGILWVPLWSGGLGCYWVGNCWRSWSQLGIWTWARGAGDGGDRLRCGAAATPFRFQTSSGCGHVLSPGLSWSTGNQKYWWGLLSCPPSVVISASVEAAAGSVSWRLSPQRSPRKEGNLPGLHLLYTSLMFPKTLIWVENISHVRLKSGKNITPVIIGTFLGGKI